MCRSGAEARESTVLYIYVCVWQVVNDIAREAEVNFTGHKPKLYYQLVSWQPALLY